MMTVFRLVPWIVVAIAAIFAAMVRGLIAETAESAEKNI